MNGGWIAAAAGMTMAAQAELAALRPTSPPCPSIPPPAVLARQAADRLAATRQVLDAHGIPARPAPARKAA